MAKKATASGRAGTNGTKEVLVKLPIKAVGVLEALTGYLNAVDPLSGRKVRADTITLALLLLHKRVHGNLDILKRIVKGQAELLEDDGQGVEDDGQGVEDVSGTTGQEQTER